MKERILQPARRYIPGIDGLRAISVMAVIAYHLDLKGAQGGFLGVAVFLVLSGYLITDQLMMEWAARRKVSIARFWVRRMKRLFPAMAMMLLLTALWLIATDTPRFMSLTGDIWSSLLFVNNWYLVFHHVSYFESLGPPSPIGHLWSLSLEEQFYALWPIALVIGLKAVPRRGRLLLCIVTGIAVSAFAMALIYKPGTDPSRVYYGTDTRAFALLTGAALAVVWPSNKRIGQITQSARRRLDWIGGAGLLALIVLFGRTRHYDESLYRGGLLWIALLTAVVLAVMLHPASRLGKGMGCKPLTWIGKRSYSLYIWHYPVIVMSNGYAAAEATSFGRVLLQVGSAFLLSALSYKYVEEPIRRGHFRMKWTSRRLKRSGRLAVIVPVFLFLLAWRLHHNQPISDPGVPTQAAVSLEGTEVPLTATADATPDLAIAVPSAALPSPAPTPAASLQPVRSASGKGVTVIGDSVMIGVEPYLKELLPDIVVDGKVGRQMTQALKVTEALRDEGQLDRRVIVELGTNGPFDPKRLRLLLDSLSDMEQVWIVTVRVPRSWQDEVNKVIREVVPEYGNALVLDWYSASKGKEDYFYEDGVHLKPEGSRYYASLIAEALGK